MKALMLAIAMLLAPTLAHAQNFQAVPLDQAPEMSEMPWLLLFTADDWQKDPMSVRVKGFIESDPAMSDVLANSRYHHMTPAHPKFHTYDRYHANSFPAVLVAAPDPQTDNDIWCNVRLAGMPETAEGLRALIPLESEVGADGDPKTAPFRWRQPPYPFRPWKDRPDDPAPSPVSPPPPAPAPSKPFVDTGIRDQLKKLFANDEKMAAAMAIMSAAKKVTGLSSPWMAIIGLLIGGGAKGYQLMKEGNDED